MQLRLRKRVEIFKSQKFFGTVFIFSGLSFRPRIYRWGSQKRIPSIIYLIIRDLKALNLETSVTLSPGEYATGIL